MNIFKDLKGIIYKIQNKINGKIYIGQTICSFYVRYGSLNWWKHIHNRYLKAEVKKYGKDNFFVEILEHSKSVEELNILEEKYAKEFDCYAPKGYNLTECGYNRRLSKETIELLSKTIELNNPDGIDVKIINIKKFCRDNNLDFRSIQRLISGEYHVYKYWTKKGVLDKNTKRNKEYTIYDEYGKEHKLINLSKFCRENNLNESGMRDVVSGIKSNHEGYCLNIKNYENRNIKPVILKKGDKIIKIDVIKRDSKKFDLNSKFVYKLRNGDIKVYKGWRVFQQ